MSTKPQIEIVTCNLGRFKIYQVVDVSNEEKYIHDELPTKFSNSDDLIEYLKEFTGMKVHPCRYSKLKEVAIGKGIDIKSSIESFKIRDTIRDIFEMTHNYAWYLIGKTTQFIIPIKGKNYLIDFGFADVFNKIREINEGEHEYFFNVSSIDCRE
jgi:hypothetical protein